MKEIGLWGGQGTNPPPGPKKSGVVAYCLVSVPHHGQVLTSPTSAAGPHFWCGSFTSVRVCPLSGHCGHKFSGKFAMGHERRLGPLATVPLMPQLPTSERTSLPLPCPPERRILELPPKGARRDRLRKGERDRIPFVPRRDVAPAHLGIALEHEARVLSYL
jgi:hypothetical protein